MSKYPYERYGMCAMDEHGTKYDPKRCACEVVSAWRWYQCTRPSGYGDRALFCKQHARKYPATSESKP